MTWVTCDMQSPWIHLPKARTSDVLRHNSMVSFDCPWQRRMSLWQSDLFLITVLSHPVLSFGGPQRLKTRQRRGQQRRLIVIVGEAVASMFCQLLWGLRPGDECIELNFPHPKGQKTSLLGYSAKAICNTFIRYWTTHHKGQSLEKSVSEKPFRLFPHWTDWNTNLTEPNWISSLHFWDFSKDWRNHTRDP